MFERLAEHGPSGLNSSLMHEVNKEEVILELIKGDLRLLCFIEKGVLFLANGYVKKGQKADGKEVSRAIQAKKKYLTEQYQ